MRMGMPVSVIVPMVAEAVRMIVAVTIAISVAARLGLCVRMRMHLRSYCTRLR
jgi:hypothetical protein